MKIMCDVYDVVREEFFQLLFKFDGAVLKNTNSVVLAFKTQEELGPLKYIGFDNMRVLYVEVKDEYHEFAISYNKDRLDVDITEKTITFSNKEGE